MLEELHLSNGAFSRLLDYLYCHLVGAWLKRQR